MSNTDTIPTDNNSSSDQTPEPKADSSSQSIDKNNIDDAKMDAAVEEIEHKESDEILAADDIKHFAPPVKPWYKRLLGKKKFTIPAVVIIVLIALATVPFTRYALAGLVLKQNFAIEVLDSQTHKPVSSASVTVRGKSGLTDSEGKLTLRVPVGSADIVVTKNYYKSADYHTTVPLSNKLQPLSIALVATGRQVPVLVVNKISSQPVSDATVTALNTSVKTDSKGQATIVLPADKAEVPGTVVASDFNKSDVTIKVTDQTASTNNFALTPSGSIYFLSNLSGKIDVVKTSLDGSNRQTVVAGTGYEDSHNTVLLATRDWKYLALLAKRGSGNPELDLIDTNTGKLTSIDQGNAGFTLVGWDDHYFIYQVSRNDLQTWQTGQTILKSFNAETSKLSIIDQTQAEGTQGDYVYQDFGNINGVHIIQDNIVYAKEWNAFYTSTNRLDGKTDQVMSVAPGGGIPKALKDFPVSAAINYQYIDSNVPNPTTIDFSVSNSGGSTYYAYANGAVTQSSSLTSDSFSQTYPTYLISPSGTQTFWAEQRDGKNILFVGDQTGANGKQIASLSDYSPYGWYTDDYLLVSKNSSELYIMSISGGTPLKLTDYYKPPQNFNGYGYGYGGL